MAVKIIQRLRQTATCGKQHHNEKTTCATILQSGVLDRSLPNDRLFISSSLHYIKYAKKKTLLVLANHLIILIIIYVWLIPRDVFEIPFSNDKTKLLPNHENVCSCLDSKL